jgi:phosphatidylglycerol lysyltransferase
MHGTHLLRDITAVGGTRVLSSPLHVGMKQQFRHRFGPFFGLLLFVVALWILHHELRAFYYQAVVRHVEELPVQRLLRALVLTIASYVVLTGYDNLSLRYIRHPLSYGKIALASFIGYAFSHNIGLSLLSGGSVRYRLYSIWGLSAAEITTVVVLNGLTFWLGILTLGGVIFICEQLVIPSSPQLPFASVRPLGMIFLLLVGGYLLCSAFRQTPLQIRQWKIPVPPLCIAFSQVALSSLDWALAASVLYVLLPPTATLSYPGFLGMFILAQIAGVVSQVPGGLGVFETMILLLLSPQLPTLSILGALVAYRGIYYLLPLGVASVLLGAHELLQRKKELRWLVGLFGQWGPTVVPHLLALITFVGGAILLFSGAAPAVHSRLTWLKDLLPLPVIELSHFLGSLAGVGLLLLARGLQQRLDAAYHMTVLLLSTGIVLSLLKGFDYEEAIMLSVMLMALFPCRRHFYRKASLFGERFTPGWIAAIVMVLLGSVWLGLFSYKHVEYSHELWWRFTLFGDAPRFLRATVGSIGAVLILAWARLLRPAPLQLALPGPAELDKASAVVGQSCHTLANLALLGDKALLFSNNGSAFIMYGREGRSWVALGDPVGPREEITELVWQYRELCDRHGGWTVFYKVGVEHLPLYLDLGLALLKIGEEARVRLATFSLKGEARKGLRYACNRSEKADCTFAMIPAEGIPTLLPELKVISDAWLAEKHTREKGFSLGRFTPDYVQQFPAGVVRQADRIVAFANLWLGAEKDELSLDLMRYLPEAPPDVMEYLIIQLMLWGKQEGYRWFNLGMAPFSGLENRALAPLWHRLGTFVFRHGEHFYNFQGLRRYKEKFAPVWEPKYLASPDGLALPHVLADLGSLIAGGLNGIVTK